jgi:hypothetical protein
MAQVVECLPSKLTTLSSIPSPGRNCKSYGATGLVKTLAQLSSHFRRCQAGSLAYPDVELKGGAQAGDRCTLYQPINSLHACPRHMCFSTPGSAHLTMSSFPALMPGTLAPDKCLESTGLPGPQPWASPVSGPGRTDCDKNICRLCICT